MKPPFDVYISADVDYVRQLEQRGLVEPNTLAIYAVGRLVVWAPKSSPIDVRRLGIQALAQPEAKRISASTVMDIEERVHILMIIRQSKLTLKKETRRRRRGGFERLIHDPDETNNAGNSGRLVHPD